MTPDLSILQSAVADNPQASAALKALVERAEKAEGEAAARLECMKAAVQPWNRGNCPGHSHRELERWDDTNKPCAECIAWNAALSGTAGRELLDELRRLRAGHGSDRDRFIAMLYGRGYVEADPLRSDALGDSEFYLLPNGGDTTIVRVGHRSTHGWHANFVFANGDGRFRLYWVCNNERPRDEELLAKVDSMREVLKANRRMWLDETPDVTLAIKMIDAVLSDPAERPANEAADHD